MLTRSVTGGSVSHEMLAMIKRVALRIAQSPAASVFVFLSMVVIFGMLKLPGEFMTTQNIATIGDSMAAPLLIGAIVSVALLGGTVDLSIGATVGVAAIVFAAIYTKTESPWLSVAVTIAI